MKKENKPISKDSYRNYLEETRGLERDYLKELIKSKRIAWFISGFFAILALLGVCAGMIGLKRPAPDPVILRVDNATGAVDVVTIVKTKELTYGNVVDEYWLNQYVINRESYDYNTIQMNYDTTAILSNPDVQQDYKKIYEGSNARDVILGNNSRIIVKVRSIQINVEGQATVRFVVQQINNNGSKQKPINLIATISYIYLNVSMLESERRVNPLGFQVTSYRTALETFSGTN